MPAPDGVEERIRTRAGRRELEDRDRLRARRRGRARERPPAERHRRLVAVGAGGARHVLDRAAEADVQLAQVGIEGAQVPGGIGEERHPCGTHLEEPRLRVVGVGGEDAGPHQRQRPLGRVAAPGGPGLVGRPAPAREHALLARAPGHSPGGQDGDGTRPLQPRSPIDRHRPLARDGSTARRPRLTVPRGPC